MSHCHVSSGWTQITRIQLADSSERVSHQSEELFQISLEDKNESLILTQEIIYLEQGSLNVWRRLNVDLICKAEYTTAQGSTKISHCHLKW